MSYNDDFTHYIYTRVMFLCVHTDIVHTAKIKSRNDKNWRKINEIINIKKNKKKSSKTAVC